MFNLSEDNNLQSDVVITGLAATASLGADAESIWANVSAGRCGMGPMPAVESLLPEGSLGGQAVELPYDYAPQLPREARYLRWTVEHALKDAGVRQGASQTELRKCAVLGTTLHGIRAGGRFLRSGNTTELSSFLASTTSQLALSGLGIDGGAITTCSACSSSLGAIALGVTLLQSGQADLVVAGGYDAISEYSWAGFNSLRLISPGPLRPFCRGRQGMKVAEGYGIVIIERAESAARRGVLPRARVAGWGESADSHHLTQPHPLGDGALAAMQQALARAGVSANELGMVAAHATGTPDNDNAEFQALLRLLGDDLARVPVVGFKSFLGHTLGGAGAVELVLSCMAIRDRRVPACANVTARDIEYPGLNVVTEEATALRAGCTLNTSLGFGGANTCIVLTDPRQPSSDTAPVGLPQEAAAPWITGVGIILAGAIGHAAFVQMADESRQSPRSQQVDSIDDAAMAEYLNVRRARRLSQYVKFTLAAACMAVRDAAIGDVGHTLANANAILGSMHGSATYCVDYYTQLINEGAGAANPVLFAEGVPNAAAAHLSTTLGVKGACQTIIGSRTAGLDALALAALRVSSGCADTIIVVAAEAPCDVVDRAYIDSGLQASDSRDATRSKRRGFRRGLGGIAFVVESARSAAARGAVPYASLLGSARASAPTPGPGGTAGAVASVISQLPCPARVIGSACGTWLDAAERVGMHRCGAIGESFSARVRFGELFSATPLAALATQLVGGPSGAQSSILCTDWSGAASAITIERLDRRLGVS